MRGPVAAKIALARAGAASTLKLFPLTDSLISKTSCLNDPGQCRD